MHQCFLSGNGFFMVSFRCIFFYAFFPIGTVIFWGLCGCAGLWLFHCNVWPEQSADSAAAGFCQALEQMEPVTDLQNPGICIRDCRCIGRGTQGVMQTYSEKSTSDKPVTVTLPSFIAYSANGNAKNVDVRVRHDKSASTVAVKYDEATNAYSFVPEKDGVYTITVSASVNNKAATPVEYKMNVGDVVGPKFALSSRHDTSEIVGKEFKFKTLTATPADGEDANKFTYTKRLYDPSGNEVTEATIKGVGTNYAGKEVKDDNTKVLLSKSGTYEVVYEVEDEVGNVTTQRYSISVTNRTGSTRVSIAAISTVLIVVGVVLIIAVILYFVLFRKRKAKNNN